MKHGLKINLLDSDSDRKARRTTVTVALVFTLIVGVLATLGAGASYRAASRGTDVFREVGNFFTLSELKKLVLGDSGNGSTDPLGTPDGKFNVLLLGIGGAGHDGAQLTDTMIFASYDTQAERLGMVSIPRDTAYPLGGGRFQKINSLNAYFEMEKPGEGAKLTADALERLLGVRIDRVVKIDFSGFEELVDALGGVDINVEKSFTDYSFPTDMNGPNPYKYTTATFTKGLEHMDGKRALTFVRSRHGTNGENSDFARSRRQQLVLSAIRERLLTLGTLANPMKVTDVWTALSSHIETDLTAWDVIKLTPSATRFSPDRITNHVLTDAADGELVPGNVDGAFMLFPKKSDWSDIRALVMDPFTTKEGLAKQNSPAQPIAVEVRNGTWRTGFAGQVATALERSGYGIVSTGNASRRGFDRTVIYDLTNGAKPTELARLKKMLDANVSATGPDGRIVSADGQPETMKSTTGTDFLIILGESSIGLVDTTAGSNNP